MYLAVTVRCWSCLRCTGLWIFLEDDFRNVFRIQFSLVRQSIHVWRQSMRLLEGFLAFLVLGCGRLLQGCLRICAELGSTADTCGASVYVAFWKSLTTFPCFPGDDFLLSPYSTLNLVRQRIHALRQFKVQHTIFELCLPSVRGFGMCMDLADPASSRKYNGTSVFTAPVAELILVSFTVPLNGWTIAATAAVVTSCSSSADFPAAGVFASRCHVVVVSLS